MGTPAEGWVKMVCLFGSIGLVFGEWGMVDFAESTMSSLYQTP